MGSVGSGTWTSSVSNAAMKASTRACKAAASPCSSRYLRYAAVPRHTHIHRERERKTNSHTYIAHQRPGRPRACVCVGKSVCLPASALMCVGHCVPVRESGAMRAYLSGRRRRPGRPRGGAPGRGGDPHPREAARAAPPGAAGARPRRHARRQRPHRRARGARPPRRPGLPPLLLCVCRWAGRAGPSAARRSQGRAMGPKARPCPVRENARLLPRPPRQTAAPGRATSPSQAHSPQTGSGPPTPP
jgi:hypothetical protein